MPDKSNKPKQYESLKFLQEAVGFISVLPFLGFLVLVMASWVKPFTPPFGLTQDVFQQVLIGGACCFGPLTLIWMALFWLLSESILLVLDVARNIELIAERMKKWPNTPVSSPYEKPQK